jgi:hypothetical protein
MIGWLYLSKGSDRFRPISLGSGLTPYFGYRAPADDQAGHPYLR